MPKKAVIHRNLRRIKLVEKDRPKRNELRSRSKDINLSPEERHKAMQELQDMPRNGSPSRRRNRCKLCGRPRAYNRLTGLCRLHMRLATINGMVPGMRKASW